MYYPCSENKGADQLRVFVFAYANCWFSHAQAHFTVVLQYETGFEIDLNCIKDVY